MSVLDRVPQVIFKTRVRDESVEGSNPFRWEDKTTQDIFGGKKVVVFSLPGARLPRPAPPTTCPATTSCTTSSRPRAWTRSSAFRSTMPFVMFQWGKQQGNKNIFLLPDGNGEFTRKMGMLVDKSNLGFGMRSWRYSMLVNDGEIEKMFVEPDFERQLPHRSLRGLRCGHHAGLPQGH